MNDPLQLGQRVRIWITGMIPRFTAEVVQVAPVRLKVLDGNWPAEMLLKDEDYIVLSDKVNQHIDEHGDKDVLRKGPLAGKIMTKAPDDRVQRLRAEIDRILEAIGYPEAFVTDESSFGDFPLENAREVMETIGQGFNPDDLLVDVAERMRGVH